MLSVKLSSKLFVSSNIQLLICLQSSYSLFSPHIQELSNNCYQHSDRQQQLDHT